MHLGAGEVEGLRNGGHRFFRHAAETMLHGVQHLEQRAGLRPDFLHGGGHCGVNVRGLGWF